jgi:RNAse (barnase) inhibitor barstar
MSLFEFKHMQTKIVVETSTIKDWESFHDCFSKTFGFPKTYGRNLDAWIDCMTSLDSPDDAMTNVHVNLGEVLILELRGVDSFCKRCPKIFEALIDCVAFVNYRKLDVDEPAILLVSYSRGDA